MAWQSELQITGEIRENLVAVGENYVPSPESDYYGNIILTSNGGGTPGVLSGGLVFSGGTIQALAGGVADDTVVSAGGRISLVSGGVVNRSVISSGGWIAVGKNGTANGTILYDVMEAYNDAVVNHTITRGYMRLFGGTANSTTVSKFLFVNANAVANDTTVSAGGVYVSSAGFASNTTVSSGGIYVSNGGVASTTTVSSGVMTVYSGGCAFDNTVSGGIMHISGGAVDSTTVAGGSMYVYVGGTANSTTVLGGSMHVSRGGTATSIAVSGGTLTVYSGAVTDGIEILAGGSLALGSAAVVNDVFVAAGANIKVNNGVANRTTVAGSMSLQPGGVANDTILTNVIEAFAGCELNDTITRGWMRMYGGVANRTIVSRFLWIYEGAEANDTIVSANTMYLGYGTRKGGVANRTTVLGGNLYVSEGGVASDTVVSGGKVTMFTGGAISGGLTFDLSGRTMQTTALLGGASILTEGVALHVAADRAGTYTLADADITTAAGGVFRVTVGNEAYAAAHTFGGTVTDWRTGLNYTVEGGTGTTLRTTAYTYSEINTAQSIFDAGNTVTDAKTGTSVYTGKISSNTSAAYFAAGTDTGSKELWLEIAGGNHNIIAAGATTDGIVGTGRVKVTGGSTLMVLGGGNLGAAQAKAEVELAGGAVGTLYGGGKQGGYAEGIGVTLSGTASVGNLYAGVLHTQNNGNFTVSGAVNLAVAAGSVTGYTFGGGKVSVAGGTASDSVTYDSNIDIAVTGGTFQTGIYALGYAKSAEASANAALTMTSGHAVNVTVDGGTFNTDLYLGALADKAIVEGASLNATVTGGTLNGTLYGGGFAQQGGAANAGAVSITVSGGSIGSIVGGGSHVNNKDTGTTTVASVAITVSGGTIGKIYAGGLYNEDKTGYHGIDKVTGDAVVTLTGSTAEIGKAAGSWNGFDTVEGARKLVLDDFTGHCSTICDFDIVTFDGTSATNDLSATTVYNVGRWGFDVIGREANAGTALVDIGDWLGGTATIDLHITDAAASLTTWSLAEFDGSLGELTFNVYDAASTELASGLALEGKITTGTFTNYGFSVDDATNTLQFGLLSA